METLEEENEIPDFRRNLVNYPQTKELLWTGSFFELPLKFFFSNITDLDTIVYLKFIFALPIDDKALSIHCQDLCVKRNPNVNRRKVLRIYSADSHPGFTQLLQDCEFQKHIRYTRIHLRRDRDNKACYTTQLMRPTDPVLEHFKCLKDVVPGFSDREEITNDWVDAILCPVWPEEAREWINRERRYGWPSKDLIESVVKSGCFLVPKPHQNNADDVGEWRISFSKAELSLIHSWNYAQMYSYHVLRLIKTDVVTKCGGNDICHLKTYHFKTLMLWACEEKSPDFWDKINLETSLRELLCTMIECLNRKECRNYFISDNNMLDYLSCDFCFENEIQILLSSAESIQFYITRTFHLLNDTVSELPVNIPRKLILMTHLAFCHGFDVTPSLTERQRYKPLEAPEETDYFRSKADALYKALSIHKNILSDKTLDQFDNKRVEIALDRFRFCRDNPIDGYSNVIFSSTDNGHSIVKKVLSISIENTDTIGNIASSSSASESTQTIVSTIVQLLNDGIEDPFYFLSSAYLVNFQYTAFDASSCPLEHWREALTLSHRLICHYEKLSIKRSFWFEINDELLSVIITRELVTIFDKYIQAVYGFYVLCMALLSGNGRNVNGRENRDIVVHVNAVHFLKYVRIQCNRKLSAVEGFVLDDRNDVAQMQRLIPFNSTTALLCSALRCRPTSTLQTQANMLHC